MAIVQANNNDAFSLTGIMDRESFEEQIIKALAGPYLRESWLMPTHCFFQGIVCRLA